MELLDIMKNRRSVRLYTEERISEENLMKILQAGLLSPTGRNLKDWEFVVVRDKKTLKKMAEGRAAGAKMLEGADCAIVVWGDESKTDVWTEDCSIAMTSMHLMADSLGIGSCWIQGRLREAADGRTTEEFLRELFGCPDNIRLEAILSLGMPAQKSNAHSLEELQMDKVHWEKF